MITIADLQAIAGNRTRSQTAKKIVDAFNKYAGEYNVNTNARISLFLAHVSIETGGFRRLDENMSYSANRLMQVWPSRFKTLAKAKQYARNPQKLANYVYGGRLGNKGKPNAGWLYRGSGPGQTTGYSNFKTVEDETGIPFTSNPDLMRDADMGMKATFILWKKWRMNDYADKNQITASRKRWNGGHHGLAEVKAAYARGMKRNLASGGSHKPKVDSKVLKFGASGKYVEALQEKLNRLGYVLDVDGDFGKATRDAVKNFQKEHGLNDDGWAGTLTMSQIGQELRSEDYRPEISVSREYIDQQASKGGLSAQGVMAAATVGTGTLGAVNEFSGVVTETVETTAGGVPSWAMSAVMIIIALAGLVWVVSMVLEKRAARKAKENRYA